MTDSHFSCSHQETNQWLLFFFATTRCWDKCNPSSLLATTPQNCTVDGVMIHVQKEQKKAGKERCPCFIEAKTQILTMVPTQYFINEKTIYIHTYAQKGLLGSLSWVPCGHREACHRCGSKESVHVSTLQLCSPLVLFYIIFLSGKIK